MKPAAPNQKKSDKTCGYDLHSFLNKYRTNQTRWLEITVSPLGRQLYGGNLKSNINFIIIDHASFK